MNKTYPIQFSIQNNQHSNIQALTRIYYKVLCILYIKDPKIQRIQGSKYFKFLKLIAGKQPRAGTPIDEDTAIAAPPTIVGTPVHADNTHNTIVTKHIPNNS